MEAGRLQSDVDSGHETCRIVQVHGCERPIVIFKDEAGLPVDRPLDDGQAVFTPHPMQQQRHRIVESADDSDAMFS